MGLLGGWFYEQFFKEYFDYLQQDNLVILGGNDNDNISHSLSGNKSAELPLHKEQDNNSWIARKDQKFDYWVLYNKVNGTKIRFRFGPGDPPEKAWAPELVDMKITDFCNMGCQFCYQSSTPNGKHGDYEYISSIISEISDYGVFELALGGGTAESHPKFIEILDYAKYRGINVTFTTKSLAWLYDPGIRKRVLKSIAGFAYSVDCSKQVRKLGAFIEDNSLFSDTEKRNKVNIQVVMGTISMWEMERILKECVFWGFRVTLLGFKEVGFGASFKKEDYSGWLDVISKMDRTPEICIDTALAKEFEKELVANNIPRYMFHVDEGKFSCYVDAVQQKIAPSSYCSQLEFVNCPPKTVIKNFETF